jgi:hypothetical protein
MFQTYTYSVLVFAVTRSLAEFWHWFVGNVPGNNVDEGEEIFQLLPPLVLPEGGGDHRLKIS